MQRNAYDVQFKNGMPELSEGIRDTLLRKGFREEQIEAAMDSLSREMVKKGLQAPNQLKISFDKIG